MVRVLSPGAAEPGGYSVVTRADDTADPSRSGSGFVVYEVTDGCVAASPTVSVVPGQQSATAGTEVSYAVCRFWSGFRWTNPASVTRDS